MSFSIICIYCGGVLSLLMALYHTRFYKLFRWKKEFEKLTDVNRRILYTVHIALLLLFFGYASVSLFYAPELGTCKGLAFGINLQYALFWLWRTIWQLYIKKPEKIKWQLFYYISTLVFFLLFISYSLPVILSLSTG